MIFIVQGIQSVVMNGDGKTLEQQQYVLRIYLYTTLGFSLWANFIMLGFKFRPKEESLADELGSKL